YPGLDRTFHRQTIGHVETGSALALQHALQLRADFVRADLGEAEPCIIGRVPRHMAEGGQRQRRQMPLPRQTGRGVEQAGAQPLPGMVGMHVQFVDVETAIDDRAEREADGAVITIGGHQQQTVARRLMQYGGRHRIAIGQVRITDLRKALLRRALDGAQDFGFVGAAGADGAGHETVNENADGRVKPGHNIETYLSFPGWTRASASLPYAKASSQVPCVEALEYSVARFSKKLVCSTPLSMASSQGSGFFSIRYIGCSFSCSRRRSAVQRM